MLAFPLPSDQESDRARGKIDLNKATKDKTINFHPIILRSGLHLQYYLPYHLAVITINNT